MTDAMETQRLDQRDSYLTSFHAHVLAVDDVEGSTWVLLDRSAFYPESGGQPHDTGTLNGALVRDVQIREGAVWHCVNGTRPAPGDDASGSIDWERRFRHMQRHTAQHLLSQAFLHVDTAFATRSVGLHGPDCTLDLAAEPLDTALAQAEALVNQVAYQNLPITSFEVDDREIEAYPLRRPPKVQGVVRLVKMGDFELSACGGTHLASTVLAAPIKVLKSERIRGNLTRVTFRTGLEALEDYREKHDVAYSLAMEFSSRVGELPERIAALRHAELTASRALANTRQRLAGEMAARLHATAVADSAAGIAIVRHELAADDDAMLQPLAEALAMFPRTVALLGIRGRGKARLMFARSTDVDLDMRSLLSAALEAVEGRGGGRPDLAQGGGTQAGRLGDALDRARARAEEARPDQP